MIICFKRPKTNLQEFYKKMECHYRYTLRTNLIKNHSNT